MAVSATAEHVTAFSETGTAPDAANAWDGTGAHSVIISGLGTAAEANTGDFATAAQGALADSATQLAFKTIQVSGQSDVVADSAADILTLVAGTNITITTNASSDSVTIAASGGGGATLDGITAATADQSGISNGDWNIVWNWQKTTNSEHAFTFGESAASTNGTSTSGVPNQSLVKIATVASSTASPLTVYSRAAHVFSVSPTSAQILATNGSSTAPTYGFASSTNTGIYWTGSNLAATIGGSLAFYTSAANFNMLATLIAKNGTAGAPGIVDASANNSGFFFGSGLVGVSCSSREIVRWSPSSSGGGWQIMDEADSNPTTTELDSLDSVAIYNKADKFVIAYNNAGTMTYISIPMDGSTTTWTHSTSAP